jgi:hypothetical protein
MLPSRSHRGDLRRCTAFHQVDGLTASREESDHEHMSATSETTPIRAFARSMGEGVVELLLRRGRLGSPPA